MQIIIKHQVENFKEWKKLFDDSDGMRKLFGEKEVKIFRDTENENEVAILFDWDDPKKILEYAQSKELKMAMELAGVIDTPRIYISDEDF